VSAAAEPLLLRSARIVDGAGELADAAVDVLIADGRVAAVGAEAASAAPSGVRELDLAGRWLGPGAWDHHVHLDQWALMRRRLDVSRATTAAEVVALVAERVAATPPGETLVGYGFRDALWPDEPTEAMLDAVAGDVPVVLVSGDLHCVWLDSAARARYVAAGEPAGLLREGPAFRVTTALADLTEAELDRNAAEAALAAAARGVVGVADLEMVDSLTAWRRRLGDGRGASSALRIRAAVYPAWLDRALAQGLRTGDVVEGTDGMLQVGDVKLITDGSLNTRTAFCHEAYPGTGGHGMSTLRGPELEAIMTRLLGTGLVPTVHAIGDAANTLALDAFAATGSSGSIEHAQLVRADDFARFGELGIVASVQPEHAMDDRDVADVIWAGRTDRAFAFSSLLAAGAELRLGSDAPVSPLDPWVSMAAAVSRARDGRDPWHPEQRIAARAAWRATTGVDGLEVGMRADLAATDLDPLSASDTELRGMPVALTLLEGRETHSTL
jgi:predicted amidohydrolase YtcJ